jgi:hypothetical protein
LNCLEGFQTYLGKVAAILKKTADNEDNLRTDLINKFQPISAAQLGIGSTSLMDMKSDTKFRIVPDFGFILPFTKGQAGFLQDFTPYMGFNVNFRSMDKNIKLRQIRYKSLRHYLSFSAGLTMRSLKIDKKRDDFFDKTSLITGLGIRLSNYLRLTGGVVWFKVPDPNVITNNTLVRLTPFVGLSVDVDLIELFGGIKTLFK